MQEKAEIMLEGVTVTPALWNGNGGEPILKGVSFSVRSGEWVTLIGGNGSGKSTMMKVLAGMLTKGISGMIARQNAREASSGIIPLVLQQPDAGIIGATPWEDIVSLLERNGAEASTIIAKAEEALRSVGLEERMRQPVETLSGGQKQLTAIAGCMAVNASILLLDEVTSMLDPIMSREVLNGVRALHRDGSAVVWVTQKLEELRSGDRVVIMHDGEIRFDGKASELFRRDSRGEANSSIAERYGLEPPYAVRTAWELQREGILLEPLPLTIEELAEAVLNDEG
ncbi:ATP-binding cassette domain-containing protein [Paenibacillus soyae]|uniref:ATP-binding cassette domain-containing protein n=1 Tax=Paenibacillus soyae TaxID=2969249 RepID=A0A9X2MRU6_9BACL|nr:ATP-binding cassette domain-containing protein [Paenibacillus soyae]MCR2805097.1 ATP-binding cassette domain-containing protein [Paenibacillus soyae]